MGSRMELFEQIRGDRRRERLSIRELAERHGVHRRTVRQAPELWTLEQPALVLPHACSPTGLPNRLLRSPKAPAT